MAERKPKPRHIVPARYSKAELKAMGLLAECAARRLKVRGDYEFQVNVKLFKPGSLSR